MATSERVFYLICEALLVIGGVVLIWGGSSHPPTGVTGRARVAKQVIGATGILLGAWPTVALLTTAWFMAMGIIVLAHATSKTVAPRPHEDASYRQ